MWGSRFTGGDPYEVDNWYPLLKDLTFETVIIPMTTAEVLAMKQRNSEWASRMQLRRWGASEDELPPLPLPQALSDLVRRVDEVVQSFSPDGAFVRLSDRSPKDAVYSCKQLKAS